VIPSRSRQDGATDVGTLWTMHRLGRRARCALMACSGDWELRILVDGQVLVSERCPRGDETFALAELLKRRMLEQGWRQILPNRMHRDTRSSRRFSIIAG
jgi:hypothetical protein